MAPKKKGNKKGNEDWEAELGESVDPIAVATQDAKDADADHDAEEAQVNQTNNDLGGGGGLLAALKKNKSKKQKKGKVVNEDYLDGEDPQTENGDNELGGIDGIDNLASKAPEEATTEDLFAAQVTKGKGGKGKQGKVEEIPKDDGDGSGEEGGTLKSKKEKEKEKKEREKQRKKEQVKLAQSVLPSSNLGLICGLSHLGCQKKDSSTYAGAQSGAYQTNGGSKS